MPRIVVGLDRQRADHECEQHPDGERQPGAREPFQPERVLLARIHAGTPKQRRYHRGARGMPGGCPPDARWTRPRGTGASQPAAPKETAECQDCGAARALRLPSGTGPMTCAHRAGGHGPLALATRWPRRVAAATRRPCSRPQTFWTFAACDPLRPGTFRTDRLPLFKGLVALSRVARVVNVDVLSPVLLDTRNRTPSAG